MRLKAVEVHISEAILTNLYEQVSFLPRWL